MFDQNRKCPIIQETESSIYKLLNNKIFIIECYDFRCTLNVNSERLGYTLLAYSIFYSGSMLFNTVLKPFGLESEWHMNIQKSHVGNVDANMDMTLWEQDSV